MAPPAPTDLKVLMTLQKGEDALPDRIIPLTPFGGIVHVGRASKTERKQLVPAKDNLWISNPVISRYHAVLFAENDNAMRVYLEDTGSSHGTYVNKKDIKDQGRTELNTGDVVQFGNKVLRGADEFDPPVYKVTIDMTNELLQKPTSSSAGRSISVPDESDDDEMDESDSDNESTDSHSSPPPHWGEAKTPTISTQVGSMSNPFAVDDELPRTPDIILIASRDASEEYEPSPADPVVHDTYADIEVEIDEDMDEEELEADETLYDRPKFTPTEVHIEAPRSPIYVPTSPTYEGLVQQPQVQLPSLDDMPLMQSITSTYNNYRDGPFAQPHRAYNSCMDFGVSDSSSSTTQTKLPMSLLPPMPSALTRPEDVSLPNLQSITVTTQELLNHGREAGAAARNGMSIDSIINPTSNAGIKRKADEMDDDEPVVGELQCEAAPATGGATREDDKPDVLIEAVEVSETINAAVPPTAPKRPAKRLRTKLASHIGAFALGGVTVLAGLMSLPDNYFA